MSNKPASYNPPDFGTEIRLPLSRNESRCAIVPLSNLLDGISAELACRYPSQLELQQRLAEEHRVDPGRIVVSAGGDESLDRVIRLAMQSRSEVLTHSPSFEMVDIYTRNHGGRLKQVAWMEGSFPVQPLLDELNPETGLVVLVSPNNPTGNTIATPDLLTVVDAARQQAIPVLVDLAYVEFADEDPTPQLVTQPNAFVLRTFSKAWGLAGLRVGYLIAPDEARGNIHRAASGPFPVSGVSLHAACVALENHRDRMQEQVGLVRQTRSQLVRLLTDLGGSPLPSQGNFVLTRFDNAEQLWQDLAERGIGVRKFPDSELLANCLRITCPSTAADWHSLVKGLQSATNREIDLESYLPLDAAPNKTAPSINAPQLSRVAQLQRKTRETDIQLQLNLDGTGTCQIATGIGFLDHMLTALAFHSRIDLNLTCNGDLHIDDHHTAEDCALALGTAIDSALGPRRGIVRFGYAYAPLDEALARTVIDLSGRPWPEVNLHLEREMLGDIATENLTHFFQSLAMTVKCSLHVDVIRGQNDHHRAEAAFKSLALALRAAIAPATDDVPSTKGMIA